MNGTNIQIYKIGIAEGAITTPPHMLRTAGLGSCVGVVLYDEHTHLSGMIHVMLPTSTIARNSEIVAYKYADTGVAKLLEQLLAKGATRSRLRAKIAGGSQMFQFQSASDIMSIGNRNVEHVKAALAQLKIPLLASHTGGNKGRTIEFNAQTLKLSVRIVNEGLIEI
ncbi:MAG: chemotaxis protein CheD [Bacilli bacterium]